MTTNLSRGPLAAALLAATASVALLAVPAQAASKPPRLGFSVQLDLENAQKAQKAGDLPGAMAQIVKAKSDASKPYDAYKANEIGISIAIAMKDMATAETLADAAADSPAMPEEDKANVVRTALILAVNAKHFDKAKTYAKVLESTNPTDPDVLSTITRAYTDSGDYADASALTQKLIASSTAANGKPDRSALQAELDIQVAQKDEAGAEKTLEEKVADYNDPSDWTQIIEVSMGTPGLRDVDAIWLGRLLFLVPGAKITPQDASLIGGTASHLTFYGDAEVAQQHGGTGFPDATPNAESDKKTMAAQIAAGDKQGGQYNAKLAEALYSYGMYPEAATAAQLAITKGGATDASEAPMVLGQALVAQNKYDDAIAAFGKVTGGGPATPRIVRLWTDYAKIMKNPPAAETAAPAPAPAPAK